MYFCFMVFSTTFPSQILPISLNFLVPHFQLSFVGLQSADTPNIWIRYILYNISTNFPITFQLLSFYIITNKPTMKYLVIKFLDPISGSPFSAFFRQFAVIHHTYEHDIFHISIDFHIAFQVLSFYIISRIKHLVVMFLDRIENIIF